MSFGSGIIVGSPRTTGGGGSGGSSSVVGAQNPLLGVGKVIHARSTGTVVPTITLANPFVTTRNLHKALVACADIRLVFAAPNTKESDAINQTIVKAGLEVSGVTYPVTFGGKASAIIDVGRGYVISDPVPVELTAGQTFWTRTFISAPFGYYIANTVLNNIGDTTVTLASLPGLTALNPVAGYLGVATYGQGGGAEQVIIKSYNGLVATLAAALTKAHALSDVMGMGPFTNGNSYGDIGEGSTSASTVAAADQSWTTTTIPANSSPQTTTTTAAASIGDTSFNIVNPTGALLATGSASLVLDTAGNAETVTVKTVIGAANPYTVLLTAPLTKAHASGVTVTGQPVGNAFKPFAITADRVASGVVVPKLTALVGDSILNGTGYSLRGERGFASLSLEDVKPYINMSLAGESAQQFAPRSGSLRRRVALAACDWMLYEYGVNDIYGGRTLSQFQADTLTIWDFCYQRGIKVAATTLTPRTTSTDLWATTGNQTITNSGSSNPVRLAYNAWLRAGAPIDPTTRAAVAVGTSGALVMASSTHPLFAVLEVADTVESARDSGLWKADASGPYTVDGIHPSSLGHGLMAAAITPATFV